mmetsp:Transcript_79857/g.200960  ORF Transcript_79857/g.200960 Transcript_79857/m.200960 type:complete len:292 (+) Transcript_79857:323-1198(+)
MPTGSQQCATRPAGVWIPIARAPRNKWAATTDLALLYLSVFRHAALESRANAAAQSESSSCCCDAKTHPSVSCPARRSEQNRTRACTARQSAGGAACLQHHQRGGNKAAATVPLWLPARQQTLHTPSITRQRPQRRPGSRRGHEVFQLAFLSQPPPPPRPLPQEPSLTASSLLFFSSLLLLNNELLLALLLPLFTWSKELPLLLELPKRKREPLKLLLLPPADIARRTILPMRAALSWPSSHLLNKPLVPKIVHCNCTLKDDGSLILFKINSLSSTLEALQFLTSISERLS